MAKKISEMTDAELSREVTGPGQIITRNASQIAAYRAQKEAEESINAALQNAMNPTNRFDGWLNDSQSKLSELLNNPDSIQNSAAYKFRVGQGQEALQRSLGARGMLNSGNRLSELVKFGQDMGSQEYDNQFSRLSDLFKTNVTGYSNERNANNANAINWAQLWSSNQNRTPVTRSISGMNTGGYNPGVFGNSNNANAFAPASTPAYDPWAENGRTVDGRTIYRNKDTGIIGYGS